MASEDRKLIIYAKIDETTYHMMLAIASERGQMVFETASELLVMLTEMELEKEEMGNHPDVRLRKLHQEVRRKKGRAQLVREMAFEHLDNPTEESLEQLEQAAEIAGMSVESVLEECEKVKPATLRFKTGNSTPNDVQEWLMSTIKPGEVYAATDVVEEGEKRGFKKYAIDEAKRAIGIDSARKGMKWYWSLPGTNFQ